MRRLRPEPGLAVLLALAAACGARAAEKERPLPKNEPKAAEQVTWVARTYHTGVILRSSDLATYRLTVRGQEASLVITEQRRQQHRRETGAWEPVGERQLHGTVQRSGERHRFSFAEGGEAFDCQRGPVAVAPASAGRMPSPGADDDECGDTGVWSAPSVEVDVLSCRPVKAPDVAGDDYRLVFAPPPGVEYLWVNDDCFQGGGYRRIPADASIAPPRASAHRESLGE